MNRLPAAIALLSVLPVLSVLSVLPSTALAGVDDDAKPVACSYCAEWEKPQAPFNIVGNTWYVGTAGLSSVLITGPQGHILVDGTLPQSAPAIARNIAALGFRIEDVRLIVNSHPHFDHAGGIAWLQRHSGAQVAAGAAAVPVLTSGASQPDDPQYQSLKDIPMPKIAQVRGVRDGETLAVGPLRITAHLTPGHTAGGASWSWRSCEKGEGKEQCRDVVFADSLNAVSDDDFHYSGNAQQPDLVATFRSTIAKVAALPCDVLVSAHPDASDVLEKAAARTAAGKKGANPFVAPGACRAYADAATRRLDDRLAKEQAR
jgi:metallo-beta-lactamase class B